MVISAQTVVIVVVAGLVFLHLTGFLPAKWRDGSRRQVHSGAVRKRSWFGIEQSAFDIGQQLSAVMASSFDRQRLMNSSEYKIFKIIEDELTATGLRVFAQTSLGEVLKSDDDAAFRAINSKRVDVLVVDRAGWPVLAVEYQGAGHYQGTAAARDAIKKEALRRAGVPYFEITTADTEGYVRDRVRELLGLAGPAGRKEQHTTMAAIGQFPIRSIGA